MPLLLDTDYNELKDYGIQHIGDEALRFLVLLGYPLPPDFYQQAACDVLLVIPKNYNQAGNDMFWTHPRVSRADGKPIPATAEPGNGNNRTFQEKEFCRWSRHWRHGASVWKPGQDNIVTILRRIEWAFRNPDAQ